MKAILAVLFLTCLSGSLAAKQQTTCPKGWTYDSAVSTEGTHATYCYRYVSQGKHDYEDAVRACSRDSDAVRKHHSIDSTDIMQGRLPESREDWQQAAIEKIMMPKKSKIYLAATWSSAKLWRYSNLPISEGDTNWDVIPKDGANVDLDYCIIMDTDGKWQRGDCTEKLPYLCMVRMDEFFDSSSPVSGSAVSRKKRSGPCDNGGCCFCFP